MDHSYAKTSTQNSKLLQKIMMEVEPQKHSQTTHRYQQQKAKQRVEFSQFTS